MLDKIVFLLKNVRQTLSTMLHLCCGYQFQEKILHAILCTVFPSNTSFIFLLLVQRCNVSFLPVAWIAIRFLMQLLAANCVSMDTNFEIVWHIEMNCKQYLAPPKYPSQIERNIIKMITPNVMFILVWF